MILKLVKHSLFQWGDRAMQERLRLINRREPYLLKRTDEELRAKTEELRQRTQRDRGRED